MFMNICTPRTEYTTRGDILVMGEENIKNFNKGKKKVHIYSHLLGTLFIFFFHSSR